MRFCLFCRDSFPEDPERCPLCGGALVDHVPDEVESDDDERRSPDEEFQGRLVPVVIVKSEDDLRTAVDILKEYGVYFEIDSADDVRRLLGLTTGRVWRILVRQEDGPEAFLRLVKAAPDLFPHEVAEAARASVQEENEASAAAKRAVDILCGSEPGGTAPAQAPGEPAGLAAPVSGSELARCILVAFAGDDSDAIGRLKYHLAKRAAAVAELLSRIAVEAVAEGGDGAERVLFNVLEVLEAMREFRALPSFESQYSSPTPQIRSRAAYAAGRLGASAAVEALLPLLEDEDEDVRYEANEAIWRLTGLDFDFDPYAPLEEQRDNIAAIRDAWARSDKRGRIQNPVDLAALLQALAGLSD